MSEGIAGLFERAEALVDQRRLLPALRTFAEAGRLTKIPVRRALASYNRGAVCWTYLGDGVAARGEFQAAVAHVEAIDHEEHPQIKVLHANALENLMLLALSYDEFEELAARMDPLAPNAPILMGLRPEIRKWHESGDSWAGRLFALAATYYNRNDPARDVGRYGCARSTYHLLLVHRRDLRVRRDDWRLALYEFCALSMRMAADCMRVRGGDDDPNPPDEFLPILTDAIPFMDEYLSVNSGDGILSKVRGDLDTMVADCHGRWAARQRRTSPMVSRTDFQVCQKCGTVFARRDMEGGHPAMMPWIDMFDHGSVMCPKCGGEVRWQPSPVVERGFGCSSALIIVALSLAAATSIVLRSLSHR